MSLVTIAARYKAAVEALHTRHSSTDVHDTGGIAGAAIAEHCALICKVTGDRLDMETKEIVKGSPPHEEALLEYYEAKRLLEEALLSSVD